VLAERGLDVVVLEAAGYFNESDFTQLELLAYQQMFWRGGPNLTADGNVSLVAGTTLGGGTTINWTNCLRTRDWVRAEWAEQGLEGVDGPGYDRHLDSVLERISANDRCSDLNGAQQRLREGAEALGWSFETIVRNADPESYTPEMAGYLGFGDQSGSKRSADRTWLSDAQEHGARFLTYTKATRVLTEGGRASGVESVWQTPDGRGAKVIVLAPRVVVACGSLESPALLLRSGIGGPAVGRNLRLHPSSVVGGEYGTDQKAWWGPPQAGLCDEFADTGEGFGFLIETAQYAPGLIGSATPWISGADHKRRMDGFRLTGTFISLTRDRGGGQVSIDANGEAVPTYAATDPLDLENLRRGIEVQIRLHEAAGAHQIGPLAEGAPTWRRGDDLEAFIDSVKRIPFRAGGYKLFSAHQMGTCRMGADPATSVAGPLGELHDTKGVWIGDGGAFPTSSGTNPMVSIMALAHRTAEAIADEAGAGARAEQAAQPA
jgi:choline dehydrogenase-like flavoprotein